MEIIRMKTKIKVKMKMNIKVKTKMKMKKVQSKREQLFLGYRHMCAFLCSVLSEYVSCGLLAGICWL
jgi:hypothetical protein